MGVIRVIKNKDFVVMNKTALHDSNLSWKAKGLHAYMLSMPDDWTFYNSELIKHATDGRDSFKSAMKELKEAGYVVRRPKQNEQGKLDGWETLVYEYPIDEKAVEREISQSVNPPLLNNKETKELKELNNKEKKYIPYSEIIDYLNQKANTNYRSSSKATQRVIKARWNEKFTLDDFKKVIDNKVADANNPKDYFQAKYLRPETLFGTKFEGYLNQKGVKKENAKSRYTGVF